MSTAQVETMRKHPRRRPILNADLPSLVTESAESSKMSLKKGETFHTPTSPPSNERDPVLSIRSLPRRAPTSLEAITASEERMTSILSRLTLDSSEDCGEDLSASLGDKSDSRSVSEPTAKRDSASRRSSIGDANDGSRKVNEHGHESDSGLGTSVSSQEDSACESETIVNDAAPQSPITSPGATFDAGSTRKRQLSLTACKQIERYMLVPILKEPKLKPFHPLVKSIPTRIVNRQIVCLRDLEKTLLWLAPKFSSSPHTYLNFAEFTIQCLHTSASHLNDRDQRLPTDRPYTNGYFLDLVSQVRRYAAMIRASRERVQQAKQASKAEQPEQPESNDTNVESTEKISLVTSAALEGGLSKNGKPAELVVMQDGKAISMRTGLPFTPEDTPATFKRTISFDERVDEGVQRSMARRKKNAPPMDINQKCSHCDKVFKRPCDLTKHEKTHSRPWKCTDSDCKYSQIGWPTEKERDRHINDKHSDAPALYKCNFQPCTYASKRESNCKQHMEKAHGWVYVRSKNNARGGSKRGSSAQSSRTPSVSTPTSKSGDFPTPVSGPSPSPRQSMFPDPPFNFNDPPMPASDDRDRMFQASPFSSSSAGMGMSYPTSLNLDSFQNQFASGDPNGLIADLEVHRQSMNYAGIPSAESVPELMGMNYDNSPLVPDSEATTMEYDWSSMRDMPDVDNQDYIGFNMGVTANQTENVYGGFAAQMSANGAFGMDIPEKANAIHGNPMLYSPDPGMENYGYAHQQRGDQDFTLYADPSMTMSQMIPSIAEHQATRPLAQSDGMFPSLHDEDSGFTSMQSWLNGRHGTTSDTYLPNDMNLEFMK
ncbi:Zinc finger C2H2 [Penicillium malachiteum]|nr:Zinc finger C2H2 [Penicillium malachiteum]